MWIKVAVVIVLFSGGCSLSNKMNFRRFKTSYLKLTREVTPKIFNVSEILEIESIKLDNWRESLGDIYFKTSSLRIISIENSLSDNEYIFINSDSITCLSLEINKNLTYSYKIMPCFMLDNFDSCLIRLAELDTPINNYDLRKHSECEDCSIVSLRKFIVNKGKIERNILFSFKDMYFSELCEKYVVGQN